jgi:hypothetical protein
LSIRKRVLAFAAAGAAALLLGGVVTSHHASRVDAAGPTHAAIGCANSTDPTQIAFPATGGVITTSSQNTIAGIAPALLSITTPNGVVECGAVFEDDASAAAAIGQDADPTTVDGGSITFTLTTGTGISTILESNATTFSVPCGSSTPPSGLTATVGTGATAPTVTGNFGGWDSCQGGVLGAGVVTPNPANVVHVALRPGATFSLIGAGSPVATISATYIRFPSLAGPFTVTAGTGCGGAVTCPATVTAVGPSTVTTNSVTVGIGVPTYASSLSPNPATISSAAGAGPSVLTDSLFHLSTVCTAIGGNVILTPLTSTALVVCGNGITTIQQYAPGAESGVVTFTTSLGVFGGTTASQGGAGQTFSVHCGAVPATVPTILIPTLGLASNFALTSCQSATANLFGGGNAGTAVVVANFVGDFTGATTQATTQVQMLVNASVALTRGCNEVITGPSVATAPVSGTVSGLVTNLVSPSSAVVSVWMFNNSLHAFQAGYFNVSGAPTDFNSVAPGQSLFICVSGAATFNPQ